MPRRGTDELYERCLALLDAAELPPRLTIDRLRGLLAERRGRPLYLHPKPAEVSPGICGTLIGLQDGDHVFYRATPSLPHQNVSILHEFGHLIGHHQPLAPLSAADVRALLRQLMPNLEPDVWVGYVLNRSSYNHPQEREAELLARMLLQRVDRSSTLEPRSVDRSDKDHLRRHFSHIFGLDQR